MPSPSTPAGLHVGIIMDGNGRWATQRGWPRSSGHRAGIEAIRRTVEAAPQAGIAVLTLYAFSTENWRRPVDEVRLLMRLLRAYLRVETGRLARSGVRLQVIGRRDRLDPRLAESIARAETVTAGGDRLHLRVAIDYSGRQAILTAAEHVLHAGVTPGASLDRETFAGHICGSPGLPDVDLIVRTSGEQRLSDFLLWEAAYAELYFTPVLWPDFGERHLEEAMTAFRARQRRFGGLAHPSSDARAA